MEFDCVYDLVVWWCIVVSNTLVCVTALSVINPAVAAAAAEVFELEIYSLISSRWLIGSSYLSIFYFFANYEEQKPL